MRAYAYLTPGGPVVVAFKGTNPASLKNWLTNLDFSSTPYPAGGSGATVHEGGARPCCCFENDSLARAPGFFKSYSSMKAQLFAALNNVTSLYRNWPVVFTGHSLGGANALLASLDFVSVSRACDVVRFSHVAVAQTFNNSVSL